MAKISILIPVYNVEKYLKRCLDSVINQTMQDIEIICVNDGSTDHSLSILEEYASKDSRIKIISQENKGLLATRKVCIHYATSEYCMILDSDDWLELNTCEMTYHYIQEYDVEILQFQYILEDCDDQKLKQQWNNAFPCNKKLSALEALSLITQYHPMLGCNIHGKLIKTSLYRNTLQHIEDISITMAEDQYISCILFYFAQSYYSIEEKYYHYQYGSGITNLSKERLKKIRNDLKLVYHSIENFYNTHEKNEIYTYIIKRKLKALHKNYLVVSMKQYLPTFVLPVLFSMYRTIRKIITYK
jgi:glycosyltransferase involved in cell wall biosynthesis